MKYDTYIYDRDCFNCGDIMHFQSRNNSWLCTNINCSNYDNAELADILLEFGEITIQ